MHIVNFFRVEAIDIARVVASGNTPKPNLSKIRNPKFKMEACHLNYLIEVEICGVWMLR